MIPLFIGERVSGAIIVEVKPESFLDILTKIEKPLVVTVVGGISKKEYKYLTIYKGLVFLTQSKAPLEFPQGVEVVTAKRILIGERMVLS